ncbi:hypothetical protein [Dyella caseinilytica]|uniref:DUF2892 domain-containing protein n=1 Tax=Dyella caseinilytica TaxID=1849581 RepID=A0ABX7GT23_9GAMM|nr:hypothetical protein [Dyella caseinilytica]QRN53459.1 hypothetical protein ISN74_18920 [Dyella caseinilytica]GFZ86662.1 hypothetical protein GCM10011408_01420 [Dyella caseinilytica]
MKLTETKFEAFVLQGLFAACLMVSGLILAAMFTTKTMPVQLALAGPVHALFATAPSTCALADISNIVCIRAEG